MIKKKVRGYTVVMMITHVGRIMIRNPNSTYITYHNNNHEIMKSTSIKRKRSTYLKHHCHFIAHFDDFAGIQTKFLVVIKNSVHVLNPEKSKRERERDRNREREKKKRER